MINCNELVLKQSKESNSRTISKLKKIKSHTCKSKNKKSQATITNCNKRYIKCNHTNLVVLIYSIFLGFVNKDLKIYNAVILCNQK